MNIENIILAIVVLVAAVYIGRRVYLIIFSKKLPKCSGCSGGCGKDLMATSKDEPKSPK